MSRTRQTRARPVALDGAGLNHWRKIHGLYIYELAHLFGFSRSKLTDRLYGRVACQQTAERLIEMIDMLLHAGIRPPGWPDRLADRVHVNRLAEIAELRNQEKATIEKLNLDQIEQ